MKNRNTAVFAGQVGLIKGMAEGIATYHTIIMKAQDALQLTEDGKKLLNLVADQQINTLKLHLLAILDNDDDLSIVETFPKIVENKE